MHVHLHCTCTCVSCIISHIFSKGHGGVIPPPNGVRSCKNTAAGLQRGHNTSLGDRDALLLHRLVDAGTVLVVHLSGWNHYNNHNYSRLWNHNKQLVLSLHLSHLLTCISRKCILKKIRIYVCLWLTLHTLILSFYLILFLVCYTLDTCSSHTYSLYKCVYTCTNLVKFIDHADSFVSQHQCSSL